MKSSLSEQRRFSLNARGDASVESINCQIKSMLLLWINAVIYVAWISNQKRVTKKTILLLITTIEMFSQHKHLHKAQQQQNQLPVPWKLYTNHAWFIARVGNFSDCNCFFMLARAYKRNAEFKHNQKHTNLCLPTILTTFLLLPPPPISHFGCSINCWSPESHERSRIKKNK